jgi:chemotaxis protein CheC
MTQLSEKQLDTLKEIINIGVGRGASVLNTMLNTHISLQVPDLRIFNQVEMAEYLTKFEESTLSAVNLPFSGQLSGSTKLIFPAESAAKLIAAFTGESFQEEDMDSIRIGTLNEIGNIVINSVMGSISNMLDVHFNYVVPNYLEGGIETIMTSNISKDNPVLLANTRFSLEKFEIMGEIAIFLQLSTIDALIESLNKFIGQ